MPVLFQRPFVFEQLRPQWGYAGIAVGCAGLLLVGLLLQVFAGLEPCPLCSLQRVCFMLIGALSLYAAIKARQGARAPVAQGLVKAGAAVGVGVAGWQSYLQVAPPADALSCGASFSYLSEMMGFFQAIPLLFQHSGSCTDVDWSFLGLSIANWSFCCFVLVLLLALAIPSGRK